jgi:hypothetical protein
MEEVPPLPDDVLELGRKVAPRIAFLVGCARSGTSILGEAIAEHPQVTYLFEVSSIWNDLVPERPDHRLLRRDATADVARTMYPALAAARDEAERAAAPRSPQEPQPGADAKAGAESPPEPDAASPPESQPKAQADGPAPASAAGKLLLEKNPKHVIRIPFLDALFPHARFLHIVRDARDTAASLMFRNRGDRWGHLEIPGWRDLLARYPSENHIRCAHQWRVAVSTARSDAKGLAPGRYREVRYEDLLKEPQGTMREVLEFLDLPPHPAVEAFLSKIQDATEGSYHAKRQVRHYVEDHSKRIGRFRENLTPRQVQEVEEICGDLMRELGY